MVRCEVLTARCAVYPARLLSQRIRGVWLRRRAWQRPCRQLQHLGRPRLPAAQPRLQGNVTAISCGPSKTMHALLEIMCVVAVLSVTPRCITIYSAPLTTMRVRMACARDLPTFDRLVDGYSSDLSMRPQVPQVHRLVAPAGQQRPVVGRQRQRRHRTEVALEGMHTFPKHEHYSRQAGMRHYWCTASPDKSWVGTCCVLALKLLAIRAHAVLCSDPSHGPTGVHWPSQTLADAAVHAHLQHRNAGLVHQVPHPHFRIVAA